MPKFKELLGHLKTKKKKPNDSVATCPPSHAQGLSEEDRIRERFISEGPSVMGACVAKEKAFLDGASGDFSSTSMQPVVQQEKCIALLFLVRSDLPFQRIWRVWIRRAKLLGLKVVVHIHSHHPPKDDDSRSQSSPDGTTAAAASHRWLRRRLIADSFNTAWGSLELVRAAVALLDHALGTTTTTTTTTDNQRSTGADNGTSQPRPSHFLFASESCLPVADPSTVLRELFGDGDVAGGSGVAGNGDGKVGVTGGGGAAGDSGVGVAAGGSGESCGNTVAPFAGATTTTTTAGHHHQRSWLRARNRPNNGYSAQLQFDPVSVAVPSNARWKADQWVLLSRAHAAACVRLPLAMGVDVLGLLRRTRAPDELYFPICLALLGELPTVEAALDLGVLADDKTAAATAAAATAAAVGAVVKDDGSSSSSSSSSSASASAAAPNIAPNIFGRRLTYCDWVSGHSAKSPAQLDWGAAVVEAARDEGCLFARKFSAGSVTLESWAELVLLTDTGGDDEHRSVLDECDSEEEEGEEEQRGGLQELGGGGRGLGSGRKDKIPARQSPNATREEDQGGWDGNRGCWEAGRGGDYRGGGGGGGGDGGGGRDRDYIGSSEWHRQEANDQNRHREDSDRRRKRNRRSRSRSRSRSHERRRW